MEQTWVRIGGVPTTSEVWDDVVSPYDGRLVARVPRCGPREVEHACSAALAALRTFPPDRRAGVLEEAGGLLAERRDEYDAAAEPPFAGPGERHRLIAEVSRAVGELTELRYVHIAS